MPCFLCALLNFFPGRMIRLHRATLPWAEEYELIDRLILKLADPLRWSASGCRIADDDTDIWIANTPYADMSLNRWTSREVFLSWLGARRLRRHVRPVLAALGLELS